MNYNVVNPVRAASKRYSLVSKIKKPIANYIDRTDLLDKVESFFPIHSNFLFICGMGGCGKTEFVKRYVELSSNYYNGNVCMLSFKGSIKETVNEGIKFINDYDDSETVEKIFLEKKRLQGTDVFTQKIQKISECGKILIIIDNYSGVGDEYLSRLLNSDADIIILSRSKVRGYESNTIDISELVALDEEILIFKKYCTSKNFSENTIIELCNVCHHHILSIVLMAKLVSEDDANLSRIYDAFGTNKKQDIKNNIVVEKDRKVSEKSIVSHLRQLIDLFDLSEDIRRTSIFIALAAPYIFSVKGFRDFFGVELYHLERLSDMNLISISNEYIYIHPLVAEIILLNNSAQEYEYIRLMDYFSENKASIDDYFIGECIHKLSQTKYEIPLEKHSELINFGAHYLFNCGRYNSAQDVYSYIYSYSYNEFEKCNSQYYYAACCKFMDKYEEGIKIFKELIKECEHNNDRRFIELVVLAYMGIANDYHGIAEKEANKSSTAGYKNAITYNKKALAIEKNTFGKKTKRTAGIYGNIALMYGCLGYKKEAYTNNLKAISLNTKIYGRDSYDVAIDYNNLGEFYKADGKYVDAKIAYLKSEAIKEKVLAEKHISKVVSWINLCDICIALHQYDEANEWIIRAQEDAVLLLDESHHYRKLLNEDIRILGERVH